MISSNFHCKHSRHLVGDEQNVNNIKRKKKIEINCVPTLNKCEMDKIANKSIVNVDEVSWLDKDISFFADDRLNDLLHHNHNANTKNCNNNIKAVSGTINQEESILFNDISLAIDNANGDIVSCGATPLTEHLPFALDKNNTLFSEININGLLDEVDEMDDMDEKVVDKSEERKEEEEKNLTQKTKEMIEHYHDNDIINVNNEKHILQNTQKFLNDIADKLPSSASHLFSETNGSIIKHYDGSGCGGIIQGTQYKTREEICNCTLVNGLNEIKQQTKYIHADSMCMDDAKQELNNLSNINWETQFFGNFNDVIPKKGNFYNLPEKVKQMIFEHKGIKNLYDWQKECLSLPAVRQRKNLIYALPTSGGKTLVAEILMLREIICREKNVLFILPYVSIVQEKVSSMSPFAIALDFLLEEYTAGKGKCPPFKCRKRQSIYIASIEKAAVLLDSLIEAERANEIGLVVIDELHLIGEYGRGATLEIILTKLMYLNANIQIVGMSATIGNLEEISQFLNADVYTRGFRPVELTEYIKCGPDLLQINYAGDTLEEIFIYKRTVNFNYSEVVKRNDPDHLAGLVTECSPQQSCLIFCSTRKNCENVAVLLSRTLPKFKFLEHRKNEKTNLMDALEKICGILSPVLAKTIPYGVAYHHSGLTTDERKFIEIAYRLGTLCVICCTSTLAAGVNLPAKRVIIRAPYVGATFMTLCKYKQMVGRAGRAGFGEAGESILICPSRDNVKVGEMLFSPMDKALSSLDGQNQLGLQSLILSSIGLGIAACLNDLYRLISITLLSVQTKCSCTKSTETSKVKQIVKDMLKYKILKMCKNTMTMVNAEDISDTITLQDVCNKSATINCNGQRQMFIDRNSKFELTAIGKAAFKAGIDYNKARIIYQELKVAQKQLILSNYSHLLYLVITFSFIGNSDDLYPVDAKILFELYQQLDNCTLRLFHLLGVTEAYVAKMIKTMSIQGPLEKQMNRLYKVLILIDLLSAQPLPIIASKYQIERGLLQNLTSQTLSGASAIVRLCDEISEFWCFKLLFEEIVKKIDRCGSMELQPLLELPAVKINRAKQLYAAGYKTIEDIAKVRPIDLVKSVMYMPMKIAKEIISAAKLIIMKKLDNLEEETALLKVCLRSDNLQ